MGSPLDMQRKDKNVKTIKNRNGKVAIGVLAAVLLAGCVGTRDCGLAVRPKHVVFVGFDGLAAWCVKENPAAMPTLARLMREGSWSLKSRSILPSSSACNWHSIFTCSASEQHGFNNWGTKAPVFPPSATGASGLYPDVFSELRAQRPSARIEYMYEWSGMAYVADTNACDFVKMARDAQLGPLSGKIIREGCPDFLAVVFHNPDSAGHSLGWGSPGYVESMKVQDGYLKMIVEAIEESGLADDTVIVLSSDHGGNGKDHGGPTLREMERTLVLWGKDVRKGHEIQGSSAVYDTGATLAALLGLDFPQAWIGRPLVDAFER